jgi:UPF0716 protein FxsA
MAARLLWFLALLPLIELFILIEIGSRIGALNTIALLVLAGILGLTLLRWEGLRTWRQIQLTLAQGDIPAEELLDGVLIFAGGILLLIPGVLTDVFGLCLLIPFTRLHFKRWLRRRFDRMVGSGAVRVQYRARTARDLLDNEPE